MSRVDVITSNRALLSVFREQQSVLAPASVFGWVFKMIPLAKNPVPHWESCLSIRYGPFSVFHRPKYFKTKDRNCWSFKGSMKEKTMFNLFAYEMKKFVYVQV